MNERAETHACDLAERQAARLAKCPFDGLNDYQRGWNDACDAIADNAPSAQLELANNSPKVDKGNDDLVERQVVIDAIESTDWYRIEGGELVHGANSKEDEPLYKAKDIYGVIENLPPAQPELIEKAAYIRGFEQGRTQGMIDAQGGKK